MIFNLKKLTVLALLSVGLFLPNSNWAQCLPEITDGCTDVLCISDFYDSGGLSSYYQSNEDLTHTVSAPTATATILVKFFDFSVYPGDTLYIYDGPSTASTLIGAYSYTTEPGKIQTSGQHITFRFISNGVSTWPGWEAEISCVCQKPVLVSEDKSICIGDVVTLYSNCDTTQVQTLYEDFEGGAAGWTTTAISGSSNWAIYSTTGGAAPIALPSNFAGNPNTGPESGFEHSYLQSPNFNTTGGGRLSWLKWLRNDNKPLDNENVEISYDGGTSWSPLVDSVHVWWLYKGFTHYMWADIPPDSGSATTTVRWRYNIGSSLGGAYTNTGFFIDEVEFNQVNNGTCNYSWSPGGGSTESINVSPLETTTYEIQGTDAFGCTEKDEVVVNILQQPEVIADPNPLICPGETVTIYAQEICEYDFITDFDGGVSWYGNMFDLEAINQVEITGFDVHQSSGTYDYELYYRVGSYVGFDSNAGAWTRIDTADNVVAEGYGVPTPIPFNQLAASPLVIPAGQTYSFYITTRGTGTIKMTYESNQGGVYESDPNLIFYEGVTKTYPFLTTYPTSGTNSYVWNGVIRYSRPDDCELEWSPGGLIADDITVSPTQEETYTVKITDLNGCFNSDQVTVLMKPVPDPDPGPNVHICPGDTTTLAISDTCENTIEVSQFNEDFINEGMMFDIYANEDLVIESFDCNLDPGSYIIRIFYKSGTHVGSETTPTDWTLLGNALNVNSAGAGNPTPIPIDINVTMLQGQTYAFYITGIQGTDMLFDLGTGVGNVSSGDANMDILDGVHLDYPYTNPQGPAIFNGYVHYKAICNYFLWAPGPFGSATNTVYPTQTTTYSVDVENAWPNQCAANASIKVIVDTLVTDAGQNVSICPSDSATLTATCTSTLPAFFEDFESGATGWTTGILDATAANGWTLVTSSGGTNPFSFGTTMYGTANNGGELGMEHSFIQSPAFDATGGGQLTFDSWANNETGYYDEESVWISYDNGTSWSILVDPANAAWSNLGATQTIAANIPADSATTQTVIRFIYDTKDGCCGPTDMVGWYVDNITFFGPCNFVWSPGGMTTATIKVSPASTTTYTVNTSTVTGCFGEDSVVVSVYGVTPPLISNLDTAYCIDDASSTMSASPPGGAFTGDGVAGNIFFPNVAGLGWDTVKYVVTDGNGCTDSTSQNVNVHGKPTPAISGNTPVCQYSTQSYTTPDNAGSSYTWGITGGTINSGGSTDSINVTWGSAGAGTLTVTEVDQFGCDSTVTMNVTLDAKPVPTITGPDSVCTLEPGVKYTTQAAFGMTYNWTVTGGTITAGAGTDAIEVDWGTSSSGTVQVQTIPINTCDTTVSISVVIVPPPSPGITGSPDTCEFKSSTFSSPLHLGTTYNWSATGGFITGGQGTQNITVSWGSAGAGLVTLIESNSLGCDSADTFNFTIQALPTPDFTNLDSAYCIDGAIDTLVGIPSGGTFSNPVVNNDQFNPSVAGLGNHTVTYSYTDGNGCFQDTSHSTIVNALPIIKIDSLDNAYCENANAVTLFGSPPGGTFSGAGIAGNTFDPAVAGVGTHVITYEYTDTNACVNTTTQSVTVQALPGVAFFGLPSTACINGSVISLSGFPGGGTFTGPGMSGSNFNPGSAGLGNKTITYAYTDQNGCTKDTSRVVNVGNIPSPNFGIDFTSQCVGDTINFIDSTTAVGGDPTASWDWDFGDGTGSSLQNPINIYGAAGTYNINMTLVSSKGCTTSTNDSLEIGAGQVTTDFLSQYFCEGDQTLFTDQSWAVGENVVHWKWDFGDGTVIDDTLNVVSHQYASPGVYTVELEVNTEKNCIGRDSADIRVWIVVDSAQFPYLADYEVDGAGWAASPIDSGVVSWVWGSPNGNVITSAYEGANAWVTGDTFLYAPNEQSVVGSPCFDLSGLDRPVIGFAKYEEFQAGFDGVVLQYSIDGDSTWVTLGQEGDPINWYNSSNITGSPGDQNFGWSGVDSTWTIAKHKLDELKGETRVRFRFALGTNSGSEFEGFAFDSLWIGERTKRVLVETFTNSTNGLDATANPGIYNLINANALDVYGVWYHKESLPGLTADPFNLDNPNDVTGRELFYGTTNPPWSIFDGNQFTGFPTLLTQKIIDARILEEPLFEIDMPKPSIPNNVLQAQATIRYIGDDPYTGELICYMVAVERVISGITTANGETNFEWTMKKMMPDAAGTQFLSAWNPLDSQTVNQSWTLQNVYDVNQIGVVTFVQDKNTKEIYQVAYGGPDGPLTSYEGPSEEYRPVELHVYPNPAQDVVNVMTPGDMMTKLQIINIHGQVVMDMEPNQVLKTIQTRDLTSGVYFVRVEARGETLTKKLEVVR